MSEALIFVQTVVATTLFFVWVVRYDNIKAEFKQFGLPDWLRDLVGVLKLSLAVLLILGIERPELAKTGSLGIASLMVCALATHVRIKNPFTKMLPALAMLALTLFIAFN